MGESNNKRNYYNFLDKWEGWIFTIIAGDAGGYTKGGVTIGTWQTLAPQLFGKAGTLATLKDMTKTERNTITDYLVKSFRRSVLQEMGLEKYPELRDDYFHSYKRVIWLAQHQTAELLAAATDAADLLGLPLEIIQVGDRYLEEQLVALIEESK
jgi:hypothetical protein